MVYFKHPILLVVIYSYRLSCVTPPDPMTRDTVGRGKMRRLQDISSATRSRCDLDGSCSEWCCTNNACASCVLEKIDRVDYSVATRLWQILAGDVSR